MKYKVWVKTSTFGISREIIEADLMHLEDGNLYFSNEVPDNVKASRSKINDKGEKTYLEIIAMIGKGHWFYVRKWKP